MLLDIADQTTRPDGEGGGGWREREGNCLKPVAAPSLHFYFLTENKTFRKQPRQPFKQWSAGFQKNISEKNVCVRESIPCIAVILQYYNVILLF